MRSTASGWLASITAVIGPLSPETAASGPPRIVPTVRTITSVSGSTDCRFGNGLPHILDAAQARPGRRVNSAEFEDSNNALGARRSEIDGNPRRHSCWLVDIGVASFVEERAGHFLEGAAVGEVALGERLHAFLGLLHITRVP
jgi:hypothetical protein